MTLVRVVITLDNRIKTMCYPKLRRFFSRFILN